MSAVAHAVRKPVMANYPTLLARAESTQDAASSWVQVARVGNFKSRKYGELPISKSMLSEMLRNFREVTPEPPTRICVDYDHLTATTPSMPGSAIAAGWVEDLQLRAGGTELWALCEWTPAAAQRIRDREYRFISPSFSTSYVHIDGREVGAALLSIALTNSPFLQGMAGVVLCSDSIMGDVAFSIPRFESATISLAELGQVVSFLPDAAATPELTDDVRAQTFVVKSVNGEFVRLATLDGQEFGWFHAADQLGPARTSAEKNPMPDKTRIDDDMTMSSEQATAELISLANTIAREHGISLSDAVKLAGAQRFDLVRLRDGHGPDSGIGTATPNSIALHDDTQTPRVLSLDARPGESFDDLCMRTARERQIALRDAVHLVGVARPDLAAAR